MHHTHLTYITCIWYMSIRSSTRNGTTALKLFLKTARGLKDVDGVHLAWNSDKWRASPNAVVKLSGSTKAGNLMRSRGTFPLIFVQEWKLCIYEWHSVLFLLLPSIRPLILLGTFLFIQPQFMLLCYVKVAETCAFEWPTWLNNFLELLQTVAKMTVLIILKKAIRVTETCWW